MRAAVLHGFDEALRMEEIADPESSGDAVVVKIAGCGVCRSDVHLAAGQYPDLPLPFVLGHEIAGSTPEHGDVIVYGSWGCGDCTHCIRGEFQLCWEGVGPGWELAGGFAEYILVPHPRYLVVLDGLDPVDAAPLADAGVTAYRSVQRARPWLPADATALVIGVGGLGQFAVQFLRLLSDARVVAVDSVDWKRARAIELGAHEAITPEGVRDLGKVTTVIDYVGSHDSLRVGSDALERAGVLVLVGEAGGHLRFGMEGVPGEAHFTTNFGGSLPDLVDVLGFARRGEIRWHVERIPLEAANDAMNRLSRGDVFGRLALVP